MSPPQAVDTDVCSGGGRPCDDSSAPVAHLEANRLYHVYHASHGGQHVRGGSPREGARSELASGAATGGGGPQAPPTRRSYCAQAPPTRTCCINTSVGELNF